MECAEDGTVNAHFVLLHVGDDDPGALTGTWVEENSGSHQFSLAQPDKHTDNVWHYTMTLPSGYIDITCATAGGAQLHNAREYAGEYECGGTGGGECPVEVQSIPKYSTTEPIGDAQAECGTFGLDVLAEIQPPKGGNFESHYYPSPTRSSPS